METVKQTKAVLPGSDLAPQGQYHERISRSRSMARPELESMFDGRKVFELIGEDFDFWCARRPEFDGSLKFDHMLVVVPKDDKKNTVNFNDLCEKSPSDAARFLKIARKIINSYTKNGADTAFGVLNTSSVDFGGQIDESDQISGYFRQPQSMMFVHLKTMGYQASDLEERPMREGEEEFVHRPLQDEMNRIVKHLAGFRLKLETVDGRYDATTVVVGEDQLPEAIEFFMKVHEALETINFMVVGGGNSMMVMTDESVGIEPLLEWKKAKKKIGQDLPSGRVSVKEAVKNIREWLRLLHSPTQIGERTLGRLFADSLVHETILEGTIVVPFIEEYLKAYLNFLEENEDTQIPWGPFYSTLFYEEKGRLAFSIVPAEIIRKGANTITGVFPQESKRPPTDEQLREIAAGDELLKKDILSRTSLV